MRKINNGSNFRKRALEEQPSLDSPACAQPVAQASKPWPSNPTRNLKKKPLTKKEKLEWLSRKHDKTVYNLDMNRERPLPALGKGTYDVDIFNSSPEAIAAALPKSNQIKFDPTNFINWNNDVREQFSKELAKQEFSWCQKQEFR